MVHIALVQNKARTSLPTPLANRYKYRLSNPPSSPGPLAQLSIGSNRNPVPLLRTEVRTTLASKGVGCKYPMTCWQQDTENLICVPIIRDADLRKTQQKWLSMRNNSPSLHSTIILSRTDFIIKQNVDSER